MPPRRVCAHPGCGVLVDRGRCSQHQPARTSRRGAHAQGYTRQWEHFRRVTFPALLLERGKLPQCGARLADGPSPYSRCAKAGHIEATNLHLDHDPPLQDWERSQPALVCDPDRVAFLCASDHSAKTLAEQRRGTRGLM